MYVVGKDHINEIDSFLPNFVQITCSIFSVVKFFWPSCMCLHLGLGRYHLNRICQATYDTMLSGLRDLSTILIIYVYISFYTLFINLEADFQRRVIPKIYIICY
jgi:hypothetical protein